MVLEDLFRRPSTLAQFRLAPLGPVMDGFCEWLRCRDFSRRAIRRRLRRVSHFNHFLRRRAIKDCQGVETSHAERFINEHLPRCRCGDPYRRRHVGTSKSIRYLMEYLSERGLVLVTSPPSAPYEKLLQEYLDYLKGNRLLFFTLNREDFSFVIHLDRQPRTSRRREAQTGSRARSGSRSERTLDAVEHSRTLMEWWPFLIFHRGGLRIKVINNTATWRIRRSNNMRGI